MRAMPPHHLAKDRLPPILGPHGPAFQKTDLQPPTAPCLGPPASGTRSISWGSAAGKLQAHEALKAGGGELADRCPWAGPGKGRGSLDFPSSQNQPGTRSNRSAGPATCCHPPLQSPVVWEHRDSAVATRAFAVRPPIGPSSSLLCDHCTHCQRPCPGRSFRDRHLTLLREAVKLATSTNGFLQRQSVVQIKVRREETPYSCAVTCVVENLTRV